jgi:hypothetical protein
MKLKTVSVEELSADTSKVIRQARKGPILVRDGRGVTVVIRHLADDDLADELIVKHPRFKASIRRARRNLARGKGIPLAEVRRRFKA